MPIYTFYFHGRNIYDDTEFEAEAQHCLKDLSEAMDGVREDWIHPDVEDYNSDVELDYVDIYDEDGTKELATVEL